MKHILVPFDETAEPRRRRHEQIVAAILNSLIRDGVLMQTGPGNRYGPGSRGGPGISGITWAFNWPYPIPQGAPGPAGRNAPAFLNGIAAPVAVQGIEGDYYLQTNGRLYQKRAAFFGVPPQWAQIATLLGPQGKAGSAGRDGRDGRDGLAGIKGDAGANGANGSNGTNGTNGADGQPGPTGVGTAGPRGQDGATWLTGDSPPPALLGSLHDLYLEKKTGNVWQKNALFFGVPPSWGVIANIIGPQGLTGKRGGDGRDGRDGAGGSGSETSLSQAVVMARIWWGG